MEESKVDQIIRSETIVKKTITKLKTINSSLREKKQELKDALNNDSLYNNADNKVKEATRERLRIKKELLETESMKKLQDEISNLKSEKKDIQLSLSDYLVNYVEKTDSKMITDEEGEEWDIVIEKKAKLL